VHAATVALTQALYDDLEQYMAWTAEEARVRRARRRRQRHGDDAASDDDDSLSESEPEFSDDELPGPAATVGTLRNVHPLHACRPHLAAETRGRLYSWGRCGAAGDWQRRGLLALRLQSWPDAERALRMCTAEATHGRIGSSSSSSLTAAMGLVGLYAQYGWPTETLQAAAQVLEYLERRQPYGKHRRMPEVVQVPNPSPAALGQTPGHHVSCCKAALRH
jgi:hypothetical protein